MQTDDTIWLTLQYSDVDNIEVLKKCCDVLGLDHFDILGKSIQIGATQTQQLFTLGLIYCAKANGIA